MNIEQKREHVANMFPNQTWKNRVKGMDDARVIAIYLSRERKDDPKPEIQMPDDKQIRLF